MIKRIIPLLLTTCFLGCAVLSQGSAHKKVSARAVPTVIQSDAQAETAVQPVVEKPVIADNVVKTGLVFGKTDFKGLLKTSYVRMTIVPQGEPNKKYYFYVGSKENQSVLPWSEGKLIEPGYFYLQLPPGKYEIVNLAIPVGSTVAEEDVALSFEVAADSVLYLGTLDINGTKERVKFGGVPVMKPGFEYELSVGDDFEAAKKDFEAMLPQHEVGVAKKVLEVKPLEVPADKK